VTLPSEVSEASYDAANELTSWNGLTFEYNADGELASEGSSTFAWNDRNQLTGVAGGLEQLELRIRPVRPPDQQDGKRRGNQIQLRRFISQDPLGLAGSGVNLYRYVSDAPTNATDPTGVYQPAGNDAKGRLKQKKSSMQDR
jgi:uncharacterized protein RhaS with RHS repeats